MQNIQSDSLTLSIRVSSGLKLQLENLAEATGRTKSFLAEEALKRYLGEESWQVQAIQESLEKANQENAKFASHTDVQEWLESWGMENERDTPQCR